MVNDKKPLEDRKKESNKVPQNKPIKSFLRLFPYLKDREKALNLKIDEKSMFYISIREYANKISNIIKKHLLILDINANDAVITDALAGVGGDTISFAQHFKFVYAIEIDKLRYEYLTNNVSIYGYKNTKIINDDCTKVLNLIEDHDAIFIDPPWEPTEESYKKQVNLRLPLSFYESLEAYCNRLMDPTYMKKVPKIIVLKLPKNYDTLHFYKTVKNKNMYYYDLKKMIILVVIV
ncbi:MAG: putative RNA methylase [Barrevirus sp.]|uniref:Putative RNA methylase n=1 Tax=Barrevirus sp. TaxID=2487763 RepID=A0A3G4ZPN2_9VIRU|nr:MAG: putative RNA methylase [Barrevirus sp.]